MTTPTSDECRGHRDGKLATNHNYVWYCTCCHHVEEALTESDKDRLVARLNQTVEERNEEVIQLKSLLLARAIKAVTTG